MTDQANTRARPKRQPQPLDVASLRDIALRYVGRYATSKARLHAYLARKVRERGWSEANPPDLEGLLHSFVELGYVNDALYAAMKGGSLVRRGYGLRRVSQGLRADGISEDDRAGAEEQARQDKWNAARILAKRKRIGPFGKALPDRETAQKHIAAFLRAGHDFATAQAWVHSAPGQEPESEED